MNDPTLARYQALVTRVRALLRESLPEGPEGPVGPARMPAHARSLIEEAVRELGQQVAAMPGAQPLALRELREIRALHASEDVISPGPRRDGDRAPPSGN